MIQHPRQNSAEFGLTSSSIIDNPEGSSNISIDQKINSEHLPINRPHISKSIFRYRQLHYRALDHAMLRYSLLARYCLINPIKIGVTVAGFREWRFERTSLFRRNFSLKKTEEKRHVQKSDSSEVFASRLLSSTHQSRYYFNVKHVINFPPLFRRFFSRSSTKRIKGSRLEHFQALQSFSTLPFTLSFYFFFCRNTPAGNGTTKFSRVLIRTQTNRQWKFTAVLQKSDYTIYPCSCHPFEDQTSSRDV